MPRKKVISNKPQQPDPKYKSTVLMKFINSVMLRGQKLTAYNIVYNALENTSKKLEVEPLALFEKVIENVRPLVSLRSLRVGGATYQVPESVQPSRGRSMCIKWIINAARNRKNGDMITRLSDEILDAYHLKGAAVKKKEDTHRMAEANKAFSHLVMRATASKNNSNNTWNRNTMR